MDDSFDSLIFLMKTDEDFSCLMQINGVVPFRNNDLDVRVINVLNSDIFPLNSHFIPVFNAAHIQSLEMLEHILIADPERPIRLILILLNICKTNSLLKLGSPFMALEAPITFPIVVLQRAS